MEAKRFCSVETQTETPPPSPSPSETFDSFSVDDELTDEELGISYRAFFAHVYTVYSFTYLWGWDEIDKAQQAPLFGRCPDLGAGWLVDTTFLRELCEPSKFGSGDQTVFDTAVRDSVELKLTSQDQEDLSPYILKQVWRVANQLFGRENGALKIEIDKLVVYGPGGHFKVHRDTLRSDKHIGTVVFTFGNTFEGGEFECPLEPTFRSIGHCEKGSVVAFYTDTLHRVAEVTAGERVSLTFRVLMEDAALIALAGAVDLSRLEEVNRKYYPNETDGDGDEMPGAVDLCGTADFWRNREADLRAKLNPLPEFKDTEFIKHLDAALGSDEEDGCQTAIVFQCNHLLPRKHNGVHSLRGVDRTFATKLIEAGYAVNVASIYAEEEYDISDHDMPVERSTRLGLPVGFVDKDNKYMVVVKLHEPETKDVDDDPPTGYTGNESAPGFLQYTTCGLAVRRAPVE